MQTELFALFFCFFFVILFFGWTEFTCLPILMRHTVLQESKTYENASVAPAAGGGPAQAQPAAGAQPQRPAHAKEYNFLDMELKYGFLQVNQTTRIANVQACVCVCVCS